ncbi:hypothetical protein CDAR_38121 [Caerostris darwini]|uniref:Uncharacterized protein n=1 Tax=Caerostris darwini TaxID=1538125 RepID=A0AAV4X1Q7_9ARAC|nr:hypothetical protein CDAR_38121 [Caerostris darwini]
MEGYRGSSSSSSNSSNDSGHPDVSSSSSGWSVRPVKGEEVQEDTVRAVPSSTSDNSPSPAAEKSPTSKGLLYEKSQLEFPENLSLRLKTVGWRKLSHEP